MNEILARKEEIEKILANCFDNELIPGLVFISCLHEQLLKKKARFPLLEYASQLLAKRIEETEQIAFLDRAVGLSEIGSYVIAGKILQLRLSSHFEESFEKAREYIIQGNEWYVCDIIGERVMGYALLRFPESTIPLLKEQLSSPEKWLVRSVG